MFQTTITIKRGKDATIIDSDVPVKIDALSPEVAADNGGRSPYDSFKLYSLGGIPDIQRSDHITDEQSGIAYVVFGSVQPYENDYLRCYIQKVLSS